MTALRQSFSLSGTSSDFDPRIDAVRADLADVALAGRLFAPHYAEAITCVCTKAFAAMHEKPDGKQCSELLQGEHFQMLDRSGGWAWGWSAHDHYVGYVAADMLAAAENPPPAALQGDMIETAQSFLGMPYLWGGRGGAGIDCSGLVQRALAAIGVAAPRDSDMQQQSLGKALAENAALARGDLIFFPGHVGIMIDPDNLIHATMHHGKTVHEPLREVVARFAAEHETPITARKRIG